MSTKYKNRSYLLFPLFTLFLLFGGIFLTISQTSERQNIESSANTAITNCSIPEFQTIQTEEERILLQLINIYRIENDTGILVWSPTLKRTAQWMNNDMVANNRFEHTDSLGRDAQTRQLNCGYPVINSGENIAKGSESAQAIFDLWKNSSTHNANMLNPVFKEAGIGSGDTYWTLELGTSQTSPTGTLITPTAPLTTTVTPTLTLTTTPTPTAPIIVPTDTETTKTPTPSILINQTDTQVVAKIKVPGVGNGGNKSPKNLTRQVVIGIYDSNNKLVLVGSGFLQYDGNDLFTGPIHLGQMANGTYYIKIASQGTLLSLVLPTFQKINSEEQNILPAVILIQGDLNTDNVIDIEDYNLALPCFQDKKCSNKNVIDFNDDGTTNAIDYNIFLSGFKSSDGD